MSTKVEYRKDREFSEELKMRTIIREESVKLGQFLRGENQKINFCVLDVSIII